MFGRLKPPFGDGGSAADFASLDTLGLWWHRVPPRFGEGRFYEGGVVKTRLSIAAMSACVVIAAFAAGFAAAEGGWKVVARASNSSRYYSYANASVDVTRPRAVRVRGYGDSLQLGGSFFCQMPDRNIRSGQAVTLRIGAAKSCMVTASLTGANGGKIRAQIELLR